MLIFDIGDKELHVETDGVQDKAIEGVKARLQELRTHNAMLYSMLKSTIDTASVFMDIDFPKGVNKLEFLTEEIMKQALAAIENKPIPVQAKEVVKNEGKD